MIEVVAYVFGISSGLMWGYVFWAPKTPFKQAFMDGLIFKSLWRKK